MGIIFDEYIKNQLEDATVDESLVQKYVVRDNKKVKKFVSDKPGFKVIYDNGKPKEVKEDKQEEINRSLSAKKTSSRRMRKGMKNRLKSFKSRRRLHIDYNKDNPSQRTVEDEK